MNLWRLISFGFHFYENFDRSVYGINELKRKKNKKKKIGDKQSEKKKKRKGGERQRGRERVRGEKN